jgi:folylpolyglutamate synthase/dihydropteroate synthase
MQDKDVRAIVRALEPVVSAFVMTRASNPRSTDPSSLAEAARRLTHKPVQVVESPEDAVAEAWRTSSEIVVAGSIFLLADVMKKLGAS